MIANGKMHILDLAAKLDETANFLCADKWKTRDHRPVEFPAPFGRDLTSEVGKIDKLKNSFFFLNKDSKDLT